ncbi:MAG TPA: hypothetical protein PLM53_07120 [Spirochaetota bacterium]|nr:hypothetical protein [Spirochaetota bacterium]HPC40813.1 hypothetical protein [Spirochaetota bacterium]HQF07797.1 hypothetical protein [Spirochaetota bacterium]HQH96850.1 hypothetical protein [Spirochaetota bacterium]HQJ70643.1 hypothetical protein [Spirochaetota bacterium]
MKKSFVPVSILTAAVIAFSPLACTKKATKDNGVKPDADISLDSVDIEKKYLTEGFISNDLYRVVIISPKEAGQSDMEYIQNKAKKRARVSMEQNLAASNIPVDRNTRAEILNLIDQHGRLSRKDIEHRRYNVFYYEITKKNMKNYLKNAASQK